MNQLKTEMRLRGFSKATISTYLEKNEKFLEFIKKEPKEVTQEDIKSFLAYLISDKNLKPRSINLTISALKFYYKDILEKEIFTKIKPPKIPKSLPTVLSKQEIKDLITNTRNIKHKLLIEFMYSSGLRVSEAVKIKMKDLDFGEGMGLIKSGKGQKDRNIILSKFLIKNLKKYLNEREEISEFIFPGRKEHLTIRMAQKAVYQAAERAGIQKNVYCHALRSSFATHLLEEEVDIRIIQELLGHANLSTTQIYTKVSRKQLKKVKSPLDNL